MAEKTIEEILDLFDDPVLVLHPQIVEDSRSGLRVTHIEWDPEFEGVTIRTSPFIQPGKMIIMERRNIHPAITESWSPLPPFINRKLLGGGD